MFGSSQSHDDTPLSDSTPPLDSNPAKSLPKGTGRWTKEEHQRFIDGLKKYGKNWKQVEEYVGTRNGAQIRSHAQKFFNRLEREYNLRIDGSKTQISQQITESLRKMSEASGSTNVSVLNEVADDGKVEEGNPSVTSTVAKEGQASLQPVDFEKTEERKALFEETHSVPPDSPKLAPLHEGVSSFRRNARKMSEDVIIKHSMSMFEVIMSKVRTSKNGIDFPKLSDLVDFGLTPSLSFRSTTNNKPGNIKEKGYHEERKIEESIPRKGSFKVNPRKISEDNIILQTYEKMEQPRKTSCVDLSEFDVFTKKVKKD